MSAIAYAPPELDIFSHPRIQNVILGSHVTALKPTCGIQHPLSTIEFFSSGSNDYYRDFSHVYLRLKVQLRADDGGNLILDNGVGVVNNLLYSMFQTFEVYLNEKLITRIDHYAYKSYLESLLSRSSDALNTHMSSSLFYLDTPAHITSSTDDNAGFKKRKDLLSAGKAVEMYGRLKCDLFDQPLLFPNGIDLRIKLTFAPESFFMWFPNDVISAKLHVMDASLYVKQVAINPGVLMAHAKILSQTNAHYPLKRVEMKAFTVSPSGRSLSLNSVCTGKLPSYICFTMVRNIDFNGNFLTNPFALIHKSVTNLSIFVNADEHRFGPMDFHTRDVHFAFAYHSIFTGSGIGSKNAGNLITPEFYSHGAWMVCADLTPDASGNIAHTSIPNNGVLRVEATFGHEIDVALTCLCLLEYDAVLEVNKERNCFVS